MISTGLKGGVSPEILVGRLGAFGLHTLAVYVSKNFTGRGAGIMATSKACIADAQFQTSGSLLL